jgi:hypothetical protein
LDKNHPDEQIAQTVNNVDTAFFDGLFAFFVGSASKTNPVD